MNNNIAEKQEEDFTEVELESNNELEVDVVDDTPEADKGKPRRAEDAEPQIPEDDEIANYSENVQKRIKQLKYEFHEERRRKEEASRLQDEAVNYARKVYEENQKLRKTLEEGEGVLVEQAKDRVAAQLDRAKSEYKEAYETGDPDKLIEAQEKLTALQNEKFRVESYKPKPQPEVKEVPEPLAKKAKVPFVVDNTIATPALLNPIEHGANIVIHSLTKFITGNGTSIGGVIIDAGTFDWSNGLFPEFTEPSPGYHGLVYHEALGPIAFIAKVRIEGLRDLGSAPSPFNSFQVIQGIETLKLRMDNHSKNALELSKWLEKRDEVKWVNYPGLESSKYKKLADKYLSNGSSGIVTFGLKKGYEAAKKVSDNTKLFSLLANIGDSKSLIIHPASTTHQQLTEEEQKSTGVTSDLIRLSVGLESVTDLKADLEQAFKTI